MKRQENFAEERFREWLVSLKIPFWYIQQDIESFLTRIAEIYDKKA